MPNTVAGSQEIVFVDTSVHGYQGLIDGLPAGATVVVLDSSLDGVAQITDYLKGLTDVAALHIISHGADGVVQVGGAWLSLVDLAERGDEIAGWSHSLSANADILLYGCDVAQSAAGQAFIGELARLTGADVAASNDATGAADLGGDWVLEQSTGAIEAPTLDISGFDDLLTHFRASSLVWKQTDVTTDSDRNIQFDIQTTFRTSFPWGVTPTVGAVFNSNYAFNFGDGQSAAMYLKVLSMDAASDSFVASVVTSTGAAFTHLYAANGNFTAGWEANARLSTTKNFNDQPWRSETVVNVGSTNHAPVSSLASIVQVADNTIATFQIPASDPDGDTLTYRIGTYKEFISSSATGATATSLVAPAGVTVSSTGLVTWDIRNTGGAATVAGDQWVMTVMVEDHDASGAVKSKTPLDFLIQVVNTTNNQAPTFTQTPGNQTLVKGATVDLALQAVDPNGNLSNIQVLNPPAGMTTELHLAHNELHIHYTPTAAGTYVVNYQATDTQGLTAQYTMTFTVNEPNTPPVVSVNAGETVLEGGSHTLLASELTTTDGQQNQAQLTYTILDAPDHGQLTRGGVALAVGSTFTQKDINDGLITFVHDGSETTSDSFQFKVADGVGGETAATTAAITVTPVNDAPLAVSDTAAGGENQTLVIDVLANDTDPDLAHSFTLVSVTQPAFGHVSVVDGKAVFNPGTEFDHLKAGDQQIVAFTYTMADNAGALSTAAVTVTVTGTNDGPVALPTPQPFAIEGGASVSINGLLATDPDDGAQLSIVSPPGLPAGVSFDPTTNQFTLDPAHPAYDQLPEGALVQVRVDYGITDGTDTVPQSVTFIVKGANDAPTVSAALTGSALEGGVSVAVDGLAGASDVDYGTTLSVVPPPTLPAGVSFNPVTGAFTLDPAHPAYNHLAAGATTEVLVSYAVTDGIASTPQTLTFTVTGTNDAPVVFPTPQPFAVEGGVAVAVNGLIGATDPDDLAHLSIVAPPALPAGVSFDPVTSQFTLDPAHPAYDQLPEGAVIQVRVDYGVTDGVDTVPQSVTFVVRGTNDAPTVSAALTGQATEGGASVTVDGLAAASDVDYGTALAVAPPATLPAGVSFANGAFTLDPTHAAYNHLSVGATTQVVVAYEVTDGVASTPQTLTFTVTGTNDAPTVSAALTGAATEGGASVTVTALAGAADVDDATTLTALPPVSLPAGVSFANGAFTLDPTHAAYNHLAAGATTQVVVSFGVSDGLAVTPQTLTFTVTGTNDAPTVSAALTAAASEGGASVTVNGLTGAADADDGTTLAVVPPATLPAGVSFANGAFTLDPTHAAFNALGVGQTATVLVSYGVSDGVVTTPQTLTFTVTGTNDAPVAAVDAASVLENGTVTLNVLVNDTDVDSGDVLTLTSVGATALGGSVAIVGGQVVYTANADSFDLLTTGQSVQDSFSYTVSDGHGGTASAVATVTVSGVANGSDLIGGNQSQNLVGTVLDERIFGGNAEDTLSGGAGADTLSGNNGKDLLLGGSGMDQLDGGNGADTLDGGAGADILDGGNGGDLLTGGAGADVFRFAGDFGPDVITDFGAGDRLQFTGLFTNFADLKAHAVQVGADVKITYDAADTITLKGVLLTSLTASDFVFG